MSGSNTDLYDPNRHENQLVAVYESRADAEAARSALLASDVPSSAVQIVDRPATTDRLEGSSTGREDEGLWRSIKSLFAPEDDVQTYHHAIGRGHAMLVVTPTGQADRSRIISILEDHNPVDVDVKAEEWRQTGGYASSTAAPTMASGMAESRASFGAPGAATTNQTSTARPLGTAQAGVAGDQGTIQVAQERLRVGKREVAQGAVRVRSYVVERPVEEQVNLHQERVQVERRPVDRAVTPGEAGLFQERTLEARATAEEAVVSKEARVVEEIALKKDAVDRTETVRDTVRETKVDIDDEGARNATKTAASTTPASPASTPASTPGGTAPRRP